MKIVLLGMSLLFALAVHAEAPQFTWNKKEIENLQGKSISAAYCKKPAGYFTKEACAIGKKDSGFANFKFKTLELVNPTTLRVGDGPRSVEITRGNTIGEFTINGKTIDFAKLTPEEIHNKISAAIPKLSASLFINRAEAADEEKSPLATAVSAMLSAKTDDDTCVATQDVINACTGSPDSKLNTTAVSLLYSLQDFNAAKEISEKVAIAKRMDKSHQLLNSMYGVSSVYINLAYANAPASCDVMVQGKKMKAKGALLSCGDAIRSAQASMDKFIEDYKVKDYANYYKDSEALEKLKAEILETKKNWVPNDSFSTIQANKVGVWRSLKVMESKENKIPAPPPAAEQNR